MQQRALQVLLLNNLDPRSADRKDTLKDTITVIENVSCD